MDTGALKKFAQAARRQLLEEVAARMEQVLQTDSIEIREKEKAVKELKEQIKKSSKEAVIDQVSYTWFNRFCALRYMDVNHYTRIGIVSPQEGFTQPEILQEAKQGVIDDDFHVNKQQVIGLLNGTLPSSNPQQEAYRLLIVGACNAYHAQMPFLFQKIDDYTELLMPDDLLSENSIIHAVRETLTNETCQDVEVIGWLYQFYISERKDEVMTGLERRKKIEANDIPAATQLFTPHWIVRYMVENTLGRLWLLNNPDSKLVDQMDFFIKPKEPETDYIAIKSPEEIKICDPACGSGHILTYAFDLLYSIYQEEGYDPIQVPSLIIQNNLFGVEIDQRAGHLAAFALMMKAREKDRRFFNRGIEPNICVLDNITFTSEEIENYKKAVGPDLFTQDLWFLLQQFEQAKNFGSLIRPQVKAPKQILARLEELGLFNDLILYSINEKVKKLVHFAEYLSPRYQVVIANPPYLGSKGMNEELKRFLNDHYSDVKSDTFSAFIIRNLELSKNKGELGFMSPFVWMFISSYKKLRKFIVQNKTITSLIQLEYSGFDGATVPICAFTLENSFKPDFKGGYVRLSDFKGVNNQPIKTLEAIQNPECSWFFRSAASNFKKIPGSPIAYWVSDRIFNILDTFPTLGKIAEARMGLATGNNAIYVRLWFECAISNIGFNYSNRSDAQESRLRWFPYSKGGPFRKWFGNNEFVVDWFDDGYELLNTKHPSGTRIWAHNFNLDYIFRDSLTWSDVTSGYLSVRFNDSGFLFDGSGTSAFFKDANEKLTALGILNTKFIKDFAKVLNPTLHFQSGDFRNVPYSSKLEISSFISNVQTLIDISKTDWDAVETSWDFSSLCLLKSDFHDQQLAKTYQTLRSYWSSTVEKVRELEKENNGIFIEAFGLQDEMTPDVPIEEITLDINPYYRYARNKSEDELESLLLADAMKEFISYGVGCMFGRYSLDKEGLILANAGETLGDYLRQVPEPSFMPDEDNVIPVLEGEWFEDDIAERLKDFLKVTFGVENFEENLAFLEEAIGRDIRSYFVRDFYNEHIKMYKKRPIYWLFSSPNGSFNALIYMHRYTPDTVSVILNEYLVPYRDKLQAHKALLGTRVVSVDASQGEKTGASREIDQINKILSELKEYEDEILYPLATQQVEIDLDDGVLVNYNKFGEALKKVTGLSGK